MDRVRFITYQGWRILLLDFTHYTLDEAPTLLTMSKRLVAEQPPGSLLILTDVSGAQFDRSSVQALKDLTVHNAPYVKRSAVVGVTGLQRVIYQAVLRFARRDIPVFADREAALAWLVRDA